MKPLLYRSLLGLAATLSLASWPAWADLEVNATVQIHGKADFEAPLAPHGAWVELGSYGRCWRPAHVAAGWRPYAAGEWVWTDCGWYWSSDEPWAWACYHYGAWVYDPAHGWVWVPQTQWAPAWVSWRLGGGYVGWAPLPPSGRFFAAQPRPEHFFFVGENHFGGPVRPTLLVKNNEAIFKATAGVGGLRRESRSLGGPGPQKVMVNYGPSLDHLQRASGKSFIAVPIGQVARHSPAPVKAGRTIAEPRAHPDTSAAAKSYTRSPERAETPARNDLRSAPDRDAGSGRDSNPGGNGERGRRSMGGGGRGRH